MEKKQALDITRRLAEGINPLTGERYSEDNCFQQGDVIRALYVAAQALEQRVELDERRRMQPQNTGKPWTTEDEAALIERFESGAPIAAIAQQLERNPGGVRARLVRLGKLTPEEAYLQS